jgi:hypothetical protein
MNLILIGVFILAIISILVVFLISRNIDCSQKDGSADHVATYVADKKGRTCVPSTCMEGYGPLTPDGICPSKPICDQTTLNTLNASLYDYMITKNWANTWEADICHPKIHFWSPGDNTNHVTIGTDPDIISSGYIDIYHKTVDAINKINGSNLPYLS